MKSIWLGVVLLVGCEGSAALSRPGAPDSPLQQPPASADGWPSFLSASSFQLRRLTTAQYLASARALLGVEPAAVPPIEPVSAVGGFEAIGASSAVVTSAGVGKFEDAARLLAHAAFGQRTEAQKRMPCTPSGVGDTACFRSFAAAFGLRALRRPLSAAELDRYVALTVAVATRTNDVWQGVEATASAFLQSPGFLYLSELGEPDPERPERNRYTSYEMASRLSYLFTSAGPDDALLAAAAADELVTAEGVKAQAERLVQLPAARATVRAFFTDLLALQGLDALARPTAVFPRFTQTLGPALKEQTLRTLEALVFDRDGDYRAVFTQRETFVDAELASFYGLAPPARSGFSPVTLPADTPRPGLLGQAGVLAVHDHSEGTSPSKRGLFVLTRLLCQPLALSPPANVTIPPLPTGMLTARQRLTEHATSPACSGCHVAMDSVGLSLEHFDALGVYRETERGMAIDDRGELRGKPYQGLAGLGAALQEDPALGPCLIQSLYASAQGHLLTELDRDSFSTLVNDFAANGARVRALLTAIATSDGFRHLPASN